MTKAKKKADGRQPPKEWKILHTNSNQYAWEVKPGDLRR